MKKAAVITIALLTLFAVAAVAQDVPAELTGKIYLRGGETHEGVVQVAEFGVVEGAGIGNDRSPSSEYIYLQVDGQEVQTAVADIAVIDADWQQTGPDGAKKWQIQSLTITRVDGETVTGTLRWLLHETTVRIKAADGTIARFHAFPVASPDFDPSNLLIKIELGDAVTAGPIPAETTPAETTPTETTPAETTPAETTPAETTPAETTPAETTPAETTPAETTPAETVPVEAVPVAIVPVIGAPQTLILTVVTPSGEKVKITIQVTAELAE